MEINGLTPLLQVFNMPRSLVFYRDIIGFEVIRDSGNGDDSSWVWLRLNDSDLMLNDQYEPGNVPSVPPDGRTEWHRDTCLYFGCADPESAYEYLRSKGIDAEPPKIAPYGMKQLYFQDPDGYAICFQCPVEK
jgi:catechol 2,3-dioxygenase-like lactoylglutathione lyase family enzyme